MYSLRRILALFLLVGISASLFGQSSSARLTGAVTDATGAVVAGANITLTDLGTQRAVAAQSDAAGNYVITALPPGQYGVEVKQTGFKTVTQTIVLQTEQVAVQNFILQVGQATENILVTSDVALVEAASSNISDIVVGRQITELPLNGRNFTQLATLVPGVTRGLQTGQATGSGNQAETFRYGNAGGASLSVNGLRPQNNNFLLDGVDNNESLVNTIIFFPPAEAIQEFRVDTSVAPAEFGRAGGGVVNNTFKSGTNQYHGTAFYFGRNQVLDASPLYFSPPGTPKPAFRRHQFGGTFGGPILKDKLFVFGDYQGLRQFLPIANETATVPTSLMRQGNFSELLTLATPIQIKDPITGLPLVNNTIPSTEIITPGQNYLNAFPAANIPGSDKRCQAANALGICILKNYAASRNQVQRFDDFDIRADLNLTSKDLVFGRYSYGREVQTTNPRLSTLPSGFGSGTQSNLPRSFAFGETHTFTPNLVNEFRFGWVHTEFGFTPPFNDKPVSADLGIPGANTSPVLGGGALIGGFNNQIEYTGDFGPYIVPEQTWQFSNGLSWIKGNHTLKLGATILRRQVNLFRPNRGKGFFFLFGDGQSPSPTGYEVSDVLAGWVNTYSVGPVLGFSHTRNWETGYYVQDDWRVTRRLTLNLGLRYDLFTWPEEEHNQQANFDLVTGHLLLAGLNGVSKSTIDTDYNNFSPRVGFAYDMFGTGKSVLRGGFGIFYFLDRGGIDNQLAQNAPFQGFSSFSFTNGFRINLAGQAPLNSTNPTLGGTVPMPSKGPIQIDPNNPTNIDVVAYPKNDKNSYAEQWNLQLQHELNPDMSVSLGYVGAHGVDLMTLFNLNRQTYGAVSGTRPFPNINAVNANLTKGTSSYNSFQAQLQRRLRKGIQFTGSYTWSHTIDDSPGTLDRTPNNEQDHFDFFNFRHERGNSNLDVKHRFVFSSLFELPFGRGKMIGGNWNAVTQAVLGGWQLSPIFTYQSGSPFDVWDGTSSPSTRPDLVGRLRTFGDVNNWFDTSAFVHPPVANGTFARPGNSPRNPYFGPARKYLDVSMSKTFSITERFKTEFRAEFYNLTNTPQFSQPDGSFGDCNPKAGVCTGQFSKVTGTQLGTEREIELALRMTF
jgi:hypothetical protein